VLTHGLNTHKHFALMTSHNMPSFHFFRRRLIMYVGQFKESASKHLCSALAQFAL
jgi:hypothetical protein